MSIRHGSGDYSPHVPVDSGIVRSVNLSRKRESHTSSHSSNGHASQKDAPRINARARLHDFKQDVKSTSKKLRDRIRPHHNREPADNDDADHGQFADEVNDHIAFASVSDKPKQIARENLHDVLDAVQTASQAVLHPTGAAKRQAASRIAVQDRPYLSEDADRDYLDLHEEQDRLQTSQSDTAHDLTGQLSDNKDRIEQLDDARDGRKVAWVTGTNIHRVIVDRKRPLLWPQKQDFRRIDAKGHQSFDILSYLSDIIHHKLKDAAVNYMGHIDYCRHDSYDSEICLRIIERLLISSSPWQAWAIALRKLYRWEEPRKTGRWAFFWSLIWYFDYPATCCLCWVVHFVLRSKYRRTTAEAIRDSHERSVNEQQSALKFDELIQTHGPSGWIDPLLEQLGPELQMQLSDTADFLEVLRNFHDWRTPYRTLCTLFTFGCAIIAATLLPRDISVRLIWGFCLCGFFVSRPIASKHTQYRRCVNAVGWIFWDIPTDAEWSLAYLEDKAQVMRQNFTEQHVKSAHISGHMPAAGHIDASEQLENSDEDTVSWHSTRSHDTGLDDADFMCFKCSTDGMSGQIVLYNKGLRFVRATTRRKSNAEAWRYEWSSVVEIRKTNHTKLNYVGPPNKGLEIIFERSGREIDVSSLHSGDDRLDEPQREQPTSVLRRLGNKIKHPFHGNDDTISSELRENMNVADMIDAQSPNVKIEGFEADAMMHQVKVKLERMQDRDKAFNCIVGFSGLRYQVLEPFTESVNARVKRRYDEHEGQADDAEHEWFN